MATVDKRAPTPRAVKRDGQLGLVVDAAATQFARNGYGNSGVAELCETLGMGRGQLYNLIGSKENLLRLIHVRVIEPIIEEAERVIQLDLPADERLRMVIRQLMEVIAEREDHVWVFFNEWRVLDPENRMTYRRRRRHYQDLVEAIVQEGVARGEFEVAEPRLVVLGLLGMANFSYQWLRPDGRLTPAEIADVFCDTVLEGIVRRSGPASNGKTSRRKLD